MPESKMLTQLKRDLRRPFGKTGRDIQRVFIDETKLLFRRQQGPDGTNWKPLTPEYAARKQGPQILIESGRLFKSLTERNHGDHIFRVRGRTLQLGTSVPYSGAVRVERDFLAVVPRKIGEVFVRTLVRSRR